MGEITRTEGLVGNTAMKAPVRVATTGAITLSGVQTIDAIAVVAGDRVLVKDQVSSIDNGIYVADSAAWSRADDCNGTRQITDGTLVYVVLGTTNGNCFFHQTATGDPVPGTDAQTWANINLGIVGVSAYIQTLLPAANAAAARAILAAAGSGLTTGSGLTMNTARLLGRTTAALGAIEEISVGTGLSLAAGSLSVTSNLAAPGATNHGIGAITFNAGAMTIPIKSAVGTDASASDPIDLYFQSATVTTGTVTKRQVTAAASLVIPSGAKLGLVDGKASRIYIGYLWDGTNLEPCIWNPVIRDAAGLYTGLFRPDAGAVYSTTIIDTSSDNAGVIYSATARTGCRIIPIARADSLQTTAGTWAQAFDKITIIGPTTPVTGARLQEIETLVTAASFNTASTTFTDVTGISAAITPTSKSNLVKCRSTLSIGASASSRVGFLLLRGAAAVQEGDAASNRLRMTTGMAPASGSAFSTVHMEATDLPDATTAQTYKMQVYTDGSTMYLNRDGTYTDTNAFATGSSTIFVEEICA